MQPAAVASSPPVFRHEVGKLVPKPFETSDLAALKLTVLDVSQDVPDGERVVLATADVPDADSFEIELDVNDNPVRARFSLIALEVDRPAIGVSRIVQREDIHIRLRDESSDFGGDQFFHREF